MERLLERLLVIGGLFVLAGLCEIGGGYLVWGWMREHKPLLWALLWGVLVDGFRPDRWDLLGAAVCIVGVIVMLAPPRG